MIVGKPLGPYRLLHKLGEGGMGEVYKAHDTRLGRDVALKVLPSEVASDPERRLRFEQEARAVAALTHPHIVTLYSLEEFQKTLFITLELVEGETLATRLARASITLPDVLRVGSTIADAVGYAHARGILHRDLKPANIMLARDGSVKVLDFGLAKLREPAATPDDSPLSATTRLGPVTRPQTVLGTPEYMSPEQAEGGALDCRSDIFSLGIVLYELATGERPFKGTSPFSVIASVLRETPRPITAVNPQAPAALADIVRRCLAKDPALRYQTARELRDALGELRQLMEPHTPPVLSPISAPETPVRRSVAVLPFLNLSADAENEFFADGITEDVIAQLSKMRALKVISRTSAMQFKKREEGLREIAAKLGVATIVEGSVRRAGNRVRIVAELVDAATDEQLWAETYDRQLTDVFEIQSDVALSIAGALRAELSPSERAHVERRAEVDIEAYQLYLKGRQYLYGLTEADLRKALEFFDRAIAREARYALAYVYQAWAHIILALGHGAGDARPRDTYARARHAVALALEIDPLCGDAHGALGALKFMADYDWAGAEQSLERGLELNPGGNFMLDAYGLLLSAEGRFDEAIAVQRRGRELDPLSPVATSDLATTLIRAGRYDEASGEARRLIEREPAFPLGHSTLGWAHLLNGESTEGLREIEEAASLSPGNTLLLAQLGEAYGMTDEPARAREVLARLTRMAEERYVPPYHFAYVYTGLGEHDKAIDLLDAAIEERAGGAYGIKGSFLFTPLRDHPRFHALLRKINLAPATRQAKGVGTVYVHEQNRNTKT